ncbi:hypothetical protein P4O66_001907 [Electrophorus voltai]|uniref:G-protein coupled receptors family 1 profile domain-containing protein n=1 Tax=Electrophorus voltai TaxID=2609070 RepID=A0AAD8Z617_9TELE|nr:hypothetical protein P4O66_001907 [Electrophorus voltai]
MSLAVADFLVGLVVMPYMVLTVEGCCWHFGATFFQLQCSLDIMLCAASILHLSGVAFDRYCAVCNPPLYSSKMSHGRAGLLITLCRAVPLIVSFGPILLSLHKLRVDVALPENACILLVNCVYAVTASLVVFYLPVVTVLVAHCKIYRAARRQAVLISAVEAQVFTRPGEDSGKKRNHRNSMRRQRKAA